MTNESLATAIGDDSPPQNLVVGSCFGANAAEASANAGVGAALGFTDEVRPVEALAAVEAAVGALAHGQSPQDAANRGEEQILRTLAEMEVYEAVQ